jgi:hypothetical protein
MWSNAYWSAIVQSYGNDTSTEKVVCSNGNVTRQKLVTESDFDITGGTATNTSYVSSGTCTWVKSGRLVTVTLNNYKTVAYTDGDKNLSTGLPIPAAYFAFNCINPDGGHSQLFSIGTDGILRGGSGTMKAGDYYQSVTYIAQ